MFDCTTCGACCCNTRDNEAEGYLGYVMVHDSRSKLLTRPDLKKRYVVSVDGAPHLRLDPSGRCAALKGKLGKQVACQVYAHRPKGCRRVTEGDAACLKARRERGIDPT